MMDIYYLNTQGEKIDFLSDDYSLQTGDLFDYGWEYQDEGENEISRFKKAITEKKLLFSFRGESKENCYKNLNRFIAVTESDILKKEPGRLYVGEYYMSCYIVRGEMSDWELDYGCIDCECTIVTDTPVWIREITKRFYREIDTERADHDLDFPYDFPHDVKRTPGSAYLENDHYAPCEFSVIIYGPCESPRITINNQPRQVFTSVEKNEYLTIDSKKKTIIRTREDGTTVNEFNHRQKYPAASIFEKIVTGINTVTYTGLTFDLKIFQERSEPEWI